ncbi:uncharacterized protein [Diadema setosum]|uniref:uncharacterized protein n=1 Tax=Diadema setosum TaxID=31175 RepID=UPI003B3B3728
MSGTALSCEVPMYSSPVNANQTACASGFVVAEGTSCSYFCDTSGYSLSGVSTIVCQSNGQFSSGVPLCTDTEDPVIVCPGNITTENSAGQNYADVSIDHPDVTDNSGEISINLPPSYRVFIGTSSVRFEAVDGAGNSAACSVYVTVQDVESPQVTCPDNFNVTTEPGQYYATVTWEDPSVQDNSGQSQISKVSYASGTRFPIGTTTVEVVASDFSNNIDSCTFDIRVWDVEPPTLTCADNIVTATDPGSNRANVTIDTPMVEDNSNPIVNGSDTYSVVIPLGTYEIVFTARDGSGNVGYCSVYVTVRDEEPPVLTCPDDIQVTAESNRNSATVSWNQPGALDNSNIPVSNPISDPVSGSSFPIGTTVVNITAADASGNVGSCLLLVTVLDFDECADGQNNCSQNAVCKNEDGSFSCRCEEGYSGDGVTCDDINECTSGASNCHSKATCTNIPGSFTCACKDGFSGDGIDCTNIDECETSGNNCDVNADCMDTQGGFACVCRTGYTGDGQTCDDINECTSGSSNCHSEAVCTNTNGSFTCACGTGYTGDGIQCLNIDECESDIHGCDVNADCQDSDGNFICVCKEGYEGSGFVCDDTDECADNTHDCDENADCVNSDGGFTCVCREGFQGDGRECDDIDECSTDVPPCHTNASCTNTNGSYVCQCLNGFSGDGFTCGVFDLCETLSPCPSVADCINEIDSYTCGCRSGYTTTTSDDDDSTLCIDIDECETSASSCHANADCINTAGSYECVCANGYGGDGVICVAVNPCLSSPCQNEGTCSTSGTSYQCQCPPTHTGVNCNTVVMENEPVEIVEEPVSVEIALGSSASFSCSFQNVDSFDWTKNDRILTDVADRSPLVISAARVGDQAFYSCIGYGSDGSQIETDKATLTLIGIDNFVVTASFDAEYNDSLADPNSAYFQQTAESIENYIEVSLHNTPEFAAPPETRVDRLTSGSVVAEMAIFLTNDTSEDAAQMTLIEGALVSRAQSSGGFMDPASIVVQSTKTCPALTWNSQYGAVEFTSGAVGTQADSTGLCPSYTLNNGQPIAVARCIGDGLSASYWDPEDNCGRNLTADERLIDLEETPVTMDNALDVAEVTSELTSNSEELTSEGLASASRLLEDIAQVQSPEPEVTAFVITTVQNILQASDEEIAAAQDDAGAPSRAVRALEDQLLVVDIDANNGTFRQVEENMAVQVIEVSPEEFQAGLAASLSVDADSSAIGDDDFRLVRGRSTEAEADVPDALIVLPSGIGDAIGSQSNVRCSFTTFVDPGLFRSSSLDGQGVNVTNGTGYRAANTPVISAAVGDSVITDLAEPVVISFTPLISNATNATCVFWDFEANNGSGDWSAEGCRLGNDSTDERPVCECTHLTNFAVLMDIYGGSTLSDREDFILEILSYVGCCMSIVGLVITLLTYLSNRKLRMKNPNQILLCLCASLLGLYITFVVMIALDSERGVAEVGVVPCSIVAGLLHFFTLSSLAWMCVEGFNMYRMFVKVVDSYVSKFLLKSSLCAWGIPAIVVFIAAGITRENYAQTDFCFVSLWPQVGGLLIPIGLILLFNLVVFVLVMQRLTKTVRGKQTSDKSERRQRLRRFQNAVCILLLMGLTWSVGYLSLIRATSVVVQGLFTVLNSLQGYFIFMLYCVRQPQIRRQWRAQFSCCLPESLRVSLDSSNFSSTLQSTRTTTWKPNNIPSGSKKKTSTTTSKFNPNSVPAATTGSLSNRIYEKNNYM